MDSIWHQIKNKAVQWLILPDETEDHQVIAWTHKENPTYVFVVNLDVEKSVEDFVISDVLGIGQGDFRFLFSTLGSEGNIERLEKGVGRVYGIA